MHASAAKRTFCETHLASNNLRMHTCRSHTAFRMGPHLRECQDHHVAPS